MAINILPLVITMLVLALLSFLLAIATVRSGAVTLERKEGGH